MPRDFIDRRRVVLFLGLSSLLSLGLPGAEGEPVVPPAHVAEDSWTPIPRADPAWRARVQANLDRTRGQRFDLVFDGDSITDGWQTGGREVWKAEYGAWPAVDFGISGDGIAHLLWRLEQGQVDGLHPRLVVLMIGTNDLSSASDARIAAGIGQVVAEYRRRCPEAAILLLGIFPRGDASDPSRARIAAINRQAASLADGKQVFFADIGGKFLAADGSLPPGVMPDKLHPSAEGYRIWAEAIRPFVAAHLPPRA